MPPSIWVEGLCRSSDTSIPSKSIQNIDNRLDLFFGRFVGSGSSEDIGLRSLIVNPVGIGKKSFPSDKFSGQASPSNMSTPAFNQ